MTANNLSVVQGQTSADLPAAPADPLVGTTIDGRYLVERVLGEGGMGLVYKAKHTVLGKDLAIKVLRPDVSKDQEIITRFRQEAQSATSIGNEHIIDISDFGTLPNGSTYFVMEFLDGVDLTCAIEQSRPMSAHRVIHISKQLCRALGAAHEREIVHRDMKPDNIYLIKRGGDSDFVKVLDFGIAKVSKQTSKLTRVGQVFGTPHYMSPEQCAGTGVDHRTDIYALGVIMYEMTAGHVPFDADNLMGILTKHMYEAPIPPHTLPPPVDVSPGLEAILLKCLAKSADQRYQTMQEVLADLELADQGAMPSAVRDGATRLPSAGVDAQERPSTAFDDDVAIPGASGKGRLIAVAAAAVLLVGAGVGGYLMFGQGGETTAAQPPTRVVTPTAPVTPPTQPVVPATAAPVPEPAQIAPPGPAVVATLRLESDPAGAEVYDGQALVGTTPLEIPRPEGSANRPVTIRLAGYQDKQIFLMATTQSPFPVRLDAVVHPAAERGRRHVTTATVSVAPQLPNPIPEPAREPERRPAPAHRPSNSEILNPFGD